ncbi:MAG: sugar phosphate nucleotidyltransferase [Candidatus Hodarchaeales archaeon]|jgi:glucose-1-phosphate thymidylyltransferase
MKALILAAGEGRRMRPLSNSFPKPTLPLLNQPLLEWIVDSLFEGGLEKVGVVISPDFPLEQLSSLDCEWFIQKNPLGVGDAILQAEEWLDTDSFLVCAGDSVFTAEFIREFRHFHINKSPTVSIATEIAPWPIMGTKSCVVLDQRGYVKRIIEKPTKEQATGNLAAAPIFVFRQTFLNELKTAMASPRGEIEVQETIQAIIDRGGHVASMESPRWIHLSSPRDLFAANMRLLDQIPTDPKAILTTAAKCISPVAIASSAKIAESAEIGPRVVIGERAKISSGVKLSNALVLPETIVQSSFSNGILWSESSLSILTKRS